MVSTLIIVFSVFAFLAWMYIIYFSGRKHKQMKPVRGADSIINREDFIYLTEQAKVEGLSKLLLDYPEAMIVAWFPDTVKKLSKFLDDGTINLNKVHLSVNTTASMVKGKTIFMMERYPYKKKEEIFIQHLRPERVIYLSSLDDALLKATGGDRIKGLMEKLGAKPDEILTHPMISNSIDRAQKAIEKKMLSDPEVKSAEEWFALNRIESIG